MASIADALGGGLNYVLPGYGAEGAPSGVAGPAKPGAPIVYDPGTGLYVNQATGGVSTDPNGQNPVKDPSLATQAARNLAVSNQFLSSLGQYGQQFNGAMAQQNSLAGDLNKTIAGTAPSVARAQLEQGLSQIVQDQNSAASGATGEDAALARQNAMHNIGNAEAATNAQTAGLRAQEVQGAEQQLGNVLGAEAGESAGMYGTGVNASLNASGQAGTEQGNRESLVQSGGKNQLTTLGSVAGALGAAGTAGGGSSSGGGASSALTGAVTSDENAKENIKPADMKDFMSKLSAVSFDYKNPGEAGTTTDHVDAGVRAQDVKKSKMGKKIVKGDSPKMKLDGVQAISAALAGIGNLHDRVAKLEKHAA